MNAQNHSLKSITSGALCVTADYPLLNDVRCPDDSLHVEDLNDTTDPHYNITVKIEAKPEVSGVIDFVHESADKPWEYFLTLKSTNASLIYVDSSGKLAALEKPAGNAVLVHNSDGSYAWQSVPADDKDYAFGRKDASWFWYPVSLCEDNCGEE